MSQHHDHVLFTGVFGVKVLYGQRVGYAGARSQSTGYLKAALVCTEAWL